MIVAFIDEMRAEGFAVESICRVLREQGCQVAARTYRSWRAPSRTVAERTIGDALVIDAVRDIAWTVDPEGRRRLTPEGLYGRRKITALVRRRMPQASPGSVDRAMRTPCPAGDPTHQGHQDHDPVQGRQARR
jgi:putative transposase